MKTFVFVLLLCCFSLFSTQAADDLLIPTILNGVLLKIKPRMSVQEVEAVLSVSYPKFVPQRGDWGGRSGYNDYKLDEQYTLSISFILRDDNKEVVADEILFSVYNWPAKRRADIKLFHWEDASSSKHSQE
jgi:hypothetical protein